MRQRLTLVLAALTAVGLITGVAWAALPPSAITVVDERSVTVADAGEVVFLVEDPELSVVEVHTNPGWVSETEAARGRQVEVDFRQGDRRVRFDAEIEDGEVRVRVRQEGDDTVTVEPTTPGPETSDPEATSPDTTAATTATSAPTTEATTGASTASSAPSGGAGSSTPSTSPTSSAGPSPSTSAATTPSTTVPGSTSSTGASTSTTLDDRSSTTLGEPNLAPGSKTYEIPGVATVGIAWSDGRLRLVSYTVASGWAAEIEDQRPDRIRIDFESEDDDARFEARLDGQDLRVEARRD